MNKINDYIQMWESLGIDVEKHNELMESMSRIHEKLFLSQKNRPDMMGRFDESFHNSHSERVREIIDYKKAGGKAIGTFCIYIPDEIALAGGVIPLPLCGGSGWSVSYADKMLPRDICPLIRSTFGMAFSKTCPYGKLMDFDIGETTCDAKKKVWDLFGFKVLEVPQKKNPIDKDLWLKEVYNFKDMIEELAGEKITPEKLKESIKLVNKKRSILQKISDFQKLSDPPISGLDVLLVSQVALNQDINKFISDGQALIEELEDRVRKGVCAYEKKGKRVLMAGSPSPMGYAKIHSIVESAGLRIVADESCTGQRYYRELVDEESDNLDEMIKAIAERYFKIDCSCFSPNKERLENIRNIVNEYKIDGVVQNILQYCHCYNVEAKIVENDLKKISIPSIKIVTDYSEEDIGQIRTRIEAFAEVLENK